MPALVFLFHLNALASGCVFNQDAVDQLQPVLISRTGMQVIDECSYRMFVACLKKSFTTIAGEATLGKGDIDAKGESLYVKDYKY